MAIFDDILKDPTYKKYFAMLPEENRAQIEENLRKLCEDFEKKVLLPLETLKKR